MSHKNKRQQNTSNTTQGRELRSRSVSQQQLTEGAMGNNQGKPPAIPPQSPQLTQPLPQIALETSIKVLCLPSLQEILYGKEDGQPEEEPRMEEIPIKSVVNMNDFLQVEGEEKVNLVMMAINKINTTFQCKLDRVASVLIDEEDGVFPRLRDCEREVDNYSDRINKLEEDNQILKEDVRMLKGVISVQEKQSAPVKEKLTEIQARSMSNNIIIDGIVNDQEDSEICKNQVKEFIKNELEMTLEDEEIKKAHRLGE